MDTLTFPKTVLAEKVAANMRVHANTYAEAMRGFRSEVIGTLREKLCEVEEYEDDWDGDVSHGRTGLYLSIQGPEFHGDDYERVLAMLTMTNQDFIALTEEQFAKYVMDEWDWTESFRVSTSTYLAH